MGQSIIIASLFLSTLQSMPLLPLSEDSCNDKISLCYLLYKMDIKVKDFYPVLRGALFHALHIFMKGREEWTTFMLCKWFIWASFSTLSFLLWNNRKGHTLSEKAQWFAIPVSKVLFQLLKMLARFRKSSVPFLLSSLSLQERIFILLMGNLEVICWRILFCHNGS